MSINKKNNHRYATTVSLILYGALVITISSSTVVKAQTSPAKRTIIQEHISNASNAKNANATTAVAAPSIKNTQQLSKILEHRNILSGNKTISNTSISTTSNSRIGFRNLYVLTSTTGKTFPIKYSVNGGKLVGMLADKDRTTLALVLDSGGKGGNMTIELPRNIIDSKGASNVDTKYQVKIDGKGVDYKEATNNMNARILSISFSKDNRFIEIIGTQMTP